MPRRKPLRRPPNPSSDTAKGVLLILAALIAMIWANSADGAVYTRVWMSPTYASLTAHTIINEGLMAVFFLLAGLEIRREVTEGSLSTLRTIAAPALGAAGGMLVPIVIYAAVAAGHADALHGWAVPIATDIAFSLAVIKALANRVHPALRVFLTALAILDDLGAIVVIAAFYAHRLAIPYLGGAAGVILVLTVLRLSGVRHILPYLIGGGALWVLMFNSGVHATVAGVALAYLLPRPTARWLEPRVSPLVGFVIVPLFALANAGVDLHGVTLRAVASPAPLGVMLGLFFGKQIGVFGATMLGRALGIVRLPAGLTIAELYGASLLCGIGFTMSLFIGDLAFRSDSIYPDVKLAVLGASLASAVLGFSVLFIVNTGKADARPRP